MIIFRLIQLTVFAVALCNASVLMASEDPLLDLLVKKGIITESEANDVASDLKKEQPVFAKPESAAIKDIRLTGRFHFQYDGLSNDADASSQNGFYFRRIRIGTKMKFYDDYYAKLIADFTGDDDFSILDIAVIGWNCSPDTTFDFGYTKVPYGMYEVESSADMKTVERTIANRYFIENDGLAFGARHSGIFFEQDLSGGFTCNAAVVTNDRGNDRDDDLTGDQNGLAVYGRLQWESYGLLLGVDAGVKQDGSSFAGGNGDIWGYGIHSEYQIGDLKLSGEFMGATVQNEPTTGKDLDPYGFSFIPSYKINDKWEVVLSYSILNTGDARLIDVDDVVRRSNVSAEKYSDGEAYYAGFNYYILGNDLKLTGGYEFAYFESSTGGVTVEGVRFRLQALY